LSGVEGDDEAGGGTLAEQSSDGSSSSSAARRITHRLPGRFVAVAQSHQLRTAAAPAGVTLGRARDVIRQGR